MASIAIVGGGFSGTLLAIQLLRHNGDYPLSITLIEKWNKPGRGLAYSTECPLHLLNVPAGKMSAFPDDPDHFLRYARTVDASVDSRTFVARMIYGDYLEKLLHHAKAANNAVSSLTVLKDEAVAIEETGRAEIAVVLRSGNTLQVDKAALCLGNFAPSDVDGLSGLGQDRRYIGNPWSDDEFQVLRPDQDVLLIGTGLTMVDKALQLLDRGYRRTIYAVSRHGLVPEGHDLPRSLSPVQAVSPTDELTLPQIVRAIRSKCQRMPADNSSKSPQIVDVSSLRRASRLNFRAVIDSIRPVSQRLWQSLTTEEKRRFLRHMRPYWDTHRHRMANEVFGNIERLRNRQQLQIFGGRITDVFAEGEFLNVSIRIRGTENTAQFRVGAVINCTGPSLDYQKIASPLAVNLIEAGLAVPHPAGMGLMVSSRFALIDRNGRESNHLFTMGSPMIGELGETTAVPELREQADRLAKTMTGCLEKPVHQAAAQAVLAAY